MINNASVQPQQPGADPKMLGGFGMQPPPQDSIGLIRAILPILTPDQLEYVTALMQNPEEFMAMNPELGNQPQASLGPDPMSAGGPPQMPPSQAGAPAPAAAPAAAPAGQASNPLSEMAMAALAPSATAGKKPQSPLPI